VRDSAGIDPGDQFQSKKARRAGAVAIEARCDALEGVAFADNIAPPHGLLKWRPTKMCPCS
jgi:hypothetical protein